jgi:hypothetical protein
VTEARRTIRAFAVIDHGVNLSGHLAVFCPVVTDFEDFFTGLGNNKREALENVFQQAELRGWDYEGHASDCARQFHFMAECTCLVTEINAEIEDAFNDRQIADVLTERYYVTIFLRGKPAMEVETKKAVYLEAIVWRRSHNQT